MLIKRFFYLGLLPAFLNGCSQYLLTGKEPAPIYESRPVVYENPEPIPEKPVAQEPEPNIEIKPLDDTNAQASVTPIELHPETSQPESTQAILTPEQENELAALEKSAAQESGNTPMPPASDASSSNPTPATDGQTTASAATTFGNNGQNPVPSSMQSAVASPQPQTTPPAVVEPQPAIPAPPPPPFEPLQSFGPLSPVVGTLVLAANKSSDKGNVESATTTIERAIRIEPRNPTLFYKLALLRLQQSKPALAENLAKKSALLAGSDKQLKKHSWLLIARARDMQNNPDGAKAARKKAEKF